MPMPAFRYRRSRKPDLISLSVEMCTSGGPECYTLGCRSHHSTGVARELLGLSFWRNRCDHTRFRLLSLRSVLWNKVTVAAQSSSLSKMTNG